jgi:hypothetical protein
MFSASGVRTLKLRRRMNPGREYTQRMAML